MNHNPYHSSSTDPSQSQYDRDVRMWAMLIHISVLAGNTVPLAGWILPIVLWQVKKDEMPELDVHGRIVVNWLLSSLIYVAISIPLLFIGVGFLTMLLLYFANILFSVIGAVKANSGEVWHYPLSIRFF